MYNEFTAEPMEGEFWQGEDELARRRNGSRHGGGRWGRKPVALRPRRYGRVFYRTWGDLIEPLVEPDVVESVIIDEGDSELGPLSATLSWVSYGGKKAPKYLMTLEQARQIPGGGVYILLGDAVSGASKDQILKAGKTINFKTRFTNYTLGVQAGLWKNLRVYVAHIPGYIPADLQIETALARFFKKTGRTLPGSQQVNKRKVLGVVKIINFLPPPLLNRIRNIKSSQLDKNITANKGASILTIDPQQDKDFEFSADINPSMHAGQNRLLSCRCRNCRTTPCSCNECKNKICSPGCSCSKCRNKGVPAATGFWQRRGNQLQVTGVAP